MLNKLTKEKIPNILTIFRIFLTPLIVFFIFYKFDDVLYHYQFLNSTFVFNSNFIVAGILFIIASATDWIDGYLSRKYNWVSSFGKIWDPIADKVLINSIFISFAIKGYTPYFIPILFILRDIIVDAMRMEAIQKNIDVSANKFGKLKTVFQIIGIIIIFFLMNNNVLNVKYFLSEKWEYYLMQNMFIFLALFMSYFSGYFYIKKTFNKK
ncbi:MAG: CDP-diacylglycerol--glycerol-3-phosphate 3-phosphatidyltransferase [Mycoplasmoidaceae bacterium]